MTKVVVGMSGGVDSSVAALLLKEQGYDVVGVSMRLWADPRGDDAKNTCCSCVDQQDAARVCADLGIPFFPVSLTELFNREVVSPFVQEYLGGRTPSPCVHCNHQLKFGELFRVAESLGGEQVATGHYARVETDRDGVHHLLAASDAGKDQSYFLFMLDQNRLSRTLFPLGKMTKDEVRSMAGRFGLHTAAKPDSQGLCFAPDGDYAGFVEQRLAEAPLSGGACLAGGSFLDPEGNVVGTHRGIHRYTVGQRRGLGISAERRKYVVRIERETGAVVLGDWNDAGRDRFWVETVHWIVGQPADPVIECEVRFRYRVGPVRAELIPAGPAKVEVHLASAQRAIAPGQAAVFYRGDEVLGGGWIE